MGCYGHRCAEGTSIDRAEHYLYSCREVGFTSDTTVQQPDPRFAGRTVPPSTPSARERECGRFPSSNEPINTRRSNALCPVPIIVLQLMSVAQNCSAVYVSGPRVP